ncbi:MAG: DinB family protein, partial [Actinomycetota bacterium]|nr:DinB family protein [Actinomycetota bacterium]
MTATALPRPAADEYGAWYAGYVRLVPDGDLLATMLGQLDQVDAFIAAAGEARGDYAYAEGKWTIKEVLAHVIDAERIFAYRALRIARRDQTG